MPFAEEQDKALAVAIGELLRQPISALFRAAGERRLVAGFVDELHADKLVTGLDPPHEEPPGEGLAPRLRAVANDLLHRLGVDFTQLWNRGNALFPQVGMGVGLAQRGSGGPHRARFLRGLGVSTGYLGLACPAFGLATLPKRFTFRGSKGLLALCLPGLRQPGPEVTEDPARAVGEEPAPSGVIMAIRGEAMELARLDDLGRSQPVDAHGALEFLDRVHAPFTSARSAPNSAGRP
jgi:hypothetical protein